MEFARFQHHVTIKPGNNHNQDKVFIDSGHHLEMDEFEYDFVPVQSAERVLILDNNGVLREAFSDMSYLLSHVVAEDIEIPPYVLDHMYAKKPREPGSEQAPAKPRKRAKRKEQVVEQFVISDTQPPPPKINIIRQRLPTSVYNSSLRPKILSGGSPQKIQLNTDFNSGGIAKERATSKYNAVHQGRSIKKEEPVKTTYSSYDELNTFFTAKNLFGGSNKYGKEHLSSNKSQKSSLNKSNASAIMDDLQRDGAPYEDEILFDFGIADDEGIVSTLGADGFSDGEFDEFGVGLEVYTNSVQNNLKSSSLSKSSILLNPRPSLRPTTHPQLPSEISDDDDSNQIMVSMNNRRTSQDWDSDQLFEQQTLKQESDIDNPERQLTNVMADKNAKPLLRDDDKLSSLQSEMKSSIDSVSSELGMNGALLCKDNSMNPKENCGGDKDIITPTAAPTKDILPTRRSSRVIKIKTPGWPEEDSITPLKRRRK